MKKNRYAAAVLLAGSLWGFMGFFRRSLDGMGVSAAGCIAVRCVFATLLFGVTILCTDRKAFRIKLRDLWIFFGSGVLSLFTFGVCYFKAMDYMSLSAAAILLYTAPCFVILMSAPLFGEKLGVRKLSAMLLAFAGCCLTSGIASGAELSGIGLVFGLASGICYALYSIFGRFAINRDYGTFTINFYSCLLAGLAAVIFDGGSFAAPICASLQDFTLAAATGLVTCYLPYLLYTVGLSNMRASAAAIMASIEPVVATAAGALVFGEALTIPAFAGIALVLAAIVVLNVKTEH